VSFWFWLWYLLLGSCRRSIRAIGPGPAPGFSPRALGFASTPLCADFVSVEARTAAAGPIWLSLSALGLSSISRKRRLCRGFSSVGIASARVRAPPFSRLFPPEVRRRLFYSSISCAVALRSRRPVSFSLNELGLASPEAPPVFGFSCRAARVGRPRLRPAAEPPCAELLHLAPLPGSIFEARCRSSRSSLPCAVVLPRATRDRAPESSSRPDFLVSCHESVTRLASVSTALEHAATESSAWLSLSDSSGVGFPSGAGQASGCGLLQVESRVRY
jgi:hypothetical protein